MRQRIAVAGLVLAAMVYFSQKRRDRMDLQQAAA